MELDVTEVVGSAVGIAVSLFVVTYLGLPLLTLPAVPEMLTGDLAAVTVLLVSTALFGTGVATLVPVQLLNFTLGGVFAFVLVGTSVSIVSSPHSPVHWVVFGVCLLGVLAGGWLSWTLKLGTQRQDGTQAT